jgi:GntR family transcriptional regulator, transcriptional repressor for pyruvate dehydrogenase complex
LLDAILSGQFNEGDPLPSERELGEQFGVSRTVVREAIRTLMT